MRARQALRLEKPAQRRPGAQCCAACPRLLWELYVTPQHLGVVLAVVRTRLAAVTPSLRRAARSKVLSLGEPLQATRRRRSEGALRSELQNSAPRSRSRL